MEAISVRDGVGMKPRIAIGERDGLVEKLGTKNTSKLEGVRRPECGLVRLYADLD